MTVYRRYSVAYVPAEDIAREAKRGIWSSKFEEPEQWRKNQREHGRRGEGK